MGSGGGGCEGYGPSCIDVWGGVRGGEEVGEVDIARELGRRRGMDLRRVGEDEGCHLEGEVLGSVSAVKSGVDGLGDGVEILCAGIRLGFWDEGRGIRFW